MTRADGAARNESAAMPGPAWLQALLPQYLDYLRFEKRYSPRTVDAAQRDLRSFAGYCGQAGVAALDAVDTHLLRAYVATRHRDGLSPSSLHRQLSMLRGFFRYQVNAGRLSANPAQVVRAPKHRRKLPAVIAADQLNEALDRGAGEDPAQLDVQDLRDLAMIELLYSAGLRLAELHGLDCTDVNAGQTEITILGKGGKERRVQIGAKARQILDVWLRARVALAAVDEPALFVSRNGKRISRAAIGTRLKHWARRVGLGAHLHPHRLRHSFATHLLESSGDLRAVQELLGHAHLSTTQIYTQLDWKRLAQVYDGAHPRARRR